MRSYCALASISLTSLTFYPFLIVHHEIVDPPCLSIVFNGALWTICIIAFLSFRPWIARTLVSKVQNTRPLVFDVQSVSQTDTKSLFLSASLDWEANKLRAFRALCRLAKAEGCRTERSVRSEHWQHWAEASIKESGLTIRRISFNVN